MVDNTNIDWNRYIKIHNPVGNIIGYICTSEIFKDNHFWRCTKKLGHSGEHNYKIYIRGESMRDSGRELYR